jgi:ABC-type phosphate/phosphonate transport system substrate-binding protein
MGAWSDCTTSTTTKHRTNATDSEALRRRAGYGKVSTLTLYSMGTFHYRLFATIVVTLALMSTCPAATLRLAVPPWSDPPPPPGAFEALAQELGRAIGTSVDVVRPPNALAYVQGLVRDDYDFVFDGAPLVGWRLATASHDLLFKLADEVAYVAVILPNSTGIRSLAGAAGRRGCLQVSPALSGVIGQAAWTNPVRQPYVINVPDAMTAYHHVRHGYCDFALLPERFYEEMELHEHGGLQVFYRFPPLPGFALTVTRRLPSEQRELARIALFSDAGRRVLKPILQGYGVADIVGADESEYLPYAALLDHEAGLGDVLDARLAAGKTALAVSTKSSTRTTQKASGSRQAPAPKPNPPGGPIHEAHSVLGSELQ